MLNVTTTKAQSVLPQRIRVADLDLDPLNPRLVVPEGVSQFELMRLLYEEEGLDELVPSFIENGYFEEEPLVVVPSDARYVVVEGNRRLATLELLLDDGLRRKLPRNRVASVDSESAEASRHDSLRYLPRPRGIIPFLGYRHITRVKKWAPFQKARFVAQLLAAGNSLDHIQETIGDTSQATKKLYQSYVIYQQSVDELNASSQQIRERFSLLEVALGQRPIKRYLGMSMSLPTRAVTRLVAEDHLDQLQDVTKWVFGDSESKAIISDLANVSSSRKSKGDRRQGGIRASPTDRRFGRLLRAYGR